MKSLENILDYEFKNPLLIKEALTHPSLAYETKRPRFDNQRLEFLGDAVIQLVLTELLYEKFPDFNEGKLTKLRARLVSGYALHNFAKSIHLGEFIMMGNGEEASGGRERVSTLADAFESIMGALYLDGGLDASKGVILRVCASAVARVIESPEEKNPKGQLQELLQAIAKESPVYEVLNETGPDHQKQFEVLVKWQNIELGQGSGNSKKIAEINAAKDALKECRWEGHSI